MNDGAGNGLRRRSRVNDRRVCVYASGKHVDESNCGMWFKTQTCMLENI
jgi:hypothetical protein